MALNDAVRRLAQLLNGRCYGARRRDEAIGPLEIVAVQRRAPIDAAERDKLALSARSGAHERRDGADERFGAIENSHVEFHRLLGVLKREAS